MARGIFALVLTVALLGSSGCVVLWGGETDGELALRRAQATAIEAYGRQYRPYNLHVAASPFPTSRFEVQAPAGTRTSVYSRDYDYHASSGW